MHRSALIFYFSAWLTYSFAQTSLYIHISDMEKKPFVNTSVEIVQLRETSYTNSDGVVEFKNIPSGIYALAIDYLYDVEYRTLQVRPGDTTIYIQLERRISFDEILIKSYQIGLADFPNATKLNGQALQNSYKDKDIPYVLVGAPGVVISSDAGNGVGYTGIRFRGLDPSHIQLTLNGIPFTDAESSLSYFVDIPDVLSVSENITLIRGNVPNRPGTPSFGGAIDIQTNQVKFKQGGQIKLQYGSYHTLKYNASVHTGLIDNKYFLEAGLSKQTSDGYIDRSDSKLKSLFLSAGILTKKNSLRFNYIHGSEKTGQAWFGLPVQYANVDSLRTYNAAGQEKYDYPYENEIDDYKQDHLQFFYQVQISNHSTWSNTLNYTHGSGFYENYKAQADLSKYSIQGYGVETADLIRQKWLDNDFFFYKSDLLIKPAKSIELRPELSLSSYMGSHFGRVRDVILDSFSRNEFFYYENKGTKRDWSAGLKIQWKPQYDWEINLDLLYRNVAHRIEGIKEFKVPLQYELHFNYFSPKLFVNYTFTENLSLFSSMGYMQREPFREDIIIGDFSNASEQLLDFELGLQVYYENKLKSSINAFYMYYPSVRSLSGELNDVGEPLFINLKNVENWGVECQTFIHFPKGFSVSNATAFSFSRIPEWIESYQVYANDWSPVQTSNIRHLNAPLAYHPKVVTFTEINQKFEWNKISQRYVALKLQHQMITDFYLDNTARQGSKLNGYSVFHLGLEVAFNLNRNSSIQFWMDVQNVFNENYLSHGWISRFGFLDDLDLTTDAYLGKEENQVYHYKGVYPQAFRHFRSGIFYKF